MRSAMDDTITPAITAFLDAVDTVMNSNTLLLKGVFENVFGHERTDDIVTYILRSPLFMDMLLWADRQREWDNYWEWTEIETDQWSRRPRAGRLVHLDVWPKLKPMSVLGFTERLHWMLCTGPSFYGDRHVTEAAALSLIIALLTDLFGADTWKPTIDPSPWIGIPRWVEHPWQFYDIQTDFLESISNSDDEADPPELAYFSAGSGDSCLFFHDDTTFYFLLTNGSP